MNRIYSIDFVRGLVMVIMALDHTRDLMHLTGPTQDPSNLATTTPILFFTRWITHLCAPTFVFLSGASAYLSVQKQGNIRESRRFLFSRGLWLIILEFTVINFLLWTDIHFRILVTQVIAAIGFGLIVLGALSKVSAKTIGIIGLVIVFGHNLLAGIAFPDHPVQQFFWSLFFNLGVFPVTPNFTFAVLYPLIPWLGILLCGFAAGALFNLPDAKRKKTLLQIGLASLTLFVALRSYNIYGNPANWSLQKDPVFSLLSFINTSKYPPSLQFDLMTLGIMFLMLYAADGIKNKFINLISVFGKVPLFYYLAHWVLVHSAMFIMVFLQGFQWSDLQFGPFLFGRPAEGSGVGLGGVYAIWVSIVLLLYPLCKWYGNYKAVHKEKAWLRYL